MVPVKTNIGPFEDLCTLTMKTLVIIRKDRVRCTLPYPTWDVTSAAHRVWLPYLVGTLTQPHDSLQRVIHHQRVGKGTSQYVIALFTVPKAHNLPQPNLSTTCQKRFRFK